jgi:hypothetical protein
VVFVRDHALQERAFAMEPADYAEGSLVEGEGNSTFDSLGDGYLQIGPEMSAPSRGVVAWAILRELGVESVQDRVSRHCSFARRVFELASCFINPRTTIAEVEQMVARTHAIGDELTKSGL